MRLLHTKTRYGFLDPEKASVHDRMAYYRVGKGYLPIQGKSPYRANQDPGDAVVEVFRVLQQVMIRDLDIDLIKAYRLVYRSSPDWLKPERLERVQPAGGRLAYPKTVEQVQQYLQMLETFGFGLLVLYVRHRLLEQAHQLIFLACEPSDA